MANQVCANCGLAYSPDSVNAGHGYSRGGVTFCCATCADGNPCECARKAHADSGTVERVFEKQSHAIGAQSQAKHTK